MGCLRFLLALTVIFAHVGTFLGFSMGDGRVAVQTFYMISGFYMSLVWSEKYSKLSSPISTFYISRALRIYPLYFIVLGGVLLIGLVGKSSVPAFHFNDAVTTLGWPTAAWVYLTQFTLIGMETPLFYSFELNNYMVVPVAWTLGLELTFYLLVPLLLPRLSILVGVLGISLLIRIVANIDGPTDSASLNSLLWSYRFFPFEIAMFLAGSLAHRIYARLTDRPLRMLAKLEVYFLTVAGMLGGLCYFRLLLPYLGEALYWLYYAMAFFGIMVLFLHTKTSKRDSYIGELSYPMYISHIPVLWVIGHFSKSENTIYIVIPVTLLVSMLLSKMQEHVDKYRHNLVKGRSTSMVN